MELEIYVIEKLKGQRQQEMEMILGATRLGGGGGIRGIIRKVFSKTGETNTNSFVQPLLGSLPSHENNCCPVINREID